MKLQHSVAVAVGGEAGTGAEPSQLPQASSRCDGVPVLQRYQHQMLVHRDEIRIELQCPLESGTGLGPGVSQQRAIVQ